MVQSRSGLKLLGLCALVLGLMAFITSSAQAETGAKWTLLNAAKTVLSEVTAELLPEVSAELDVTPVLLTEVSKKKVELSCTNIVIEGAKLKTQGTVGEGKATFTGCTTKIGGALQGVCKPHSKGDEQGTVKSNQAHGLLELHTLEGGEKHLVVLILPVTGPTGQFVDLVLGKEGVENECSIGEKLPVSGRLAIQDGGATKITEHAVKHLIVEFPALTDAWVLNKTAEHKATVDGSAWAFLVGAHSGMLFAGLA